MCLAQGHNALPPVGLQPATLDLKSSTLPLSHSAPTNQYMMAITLVAFSHFQKLTRPGGY